MPQMKPYGAKPAGGKKPAGKPMAKPKPKPMGKK
jgi:hypothetical protein